MKCSTEGSTGVVLSDLRNVDRPGACIAAPWAMLGVWGVLLISREGSVWGRGVVVSLQLVWIYCSPMFLGVDSEVVESIM